MVPVAMCVEAGVIPLSLAWLAVDLHSSYDMHRHWLFSERLLLTHLILEGHGR